MFRSAILATLLGVLPGAIGCAKKSMSDRDVRREQLRINAEKKRQELEPLVGNYRGRLTNGNGQDQDVSLHLELKDVPETEGGQVDPVLVPTVNGALSLTYGPGPNIELYSFGTTRADFNASESRLDMIVANSIFKEVNLSLALAGDGLDGTWSSPSTSQSGTIALARSPELYLGGETPSLKGVYTGLLEFRDASYFMRGELTFITTQDAVDSFHVSASLRASAGRETFIYEFENVEFNPLTRQVTIRSEEAEIYFSGQLGDRQIRGEWFSKRSGFLGPAVFALEQLDEPQDKTENPVASGNWYGEVKNTQSDSRLPARLMLGFNAVPQADVPGGLTLVGSVRFYYGPFSSTEYVEHRFVSIDYQPYARKVVAVTEGTPKLTIQLDLTNNGATGIVTDSSLGNVASFTAGRQASSDGASSLAGPYDGYFLYDSLDAYQATQINLVPASGTGGLKVNASLTMGFGGLGTGEALVYRFDEADFNAVTGVLNLQSEGADVVVKGKVQGNDISGEWFSTTMGRMGRFALTKGTPAAAPNAFSRLEKVKGTYRGALRNTNPDTNLPERVMFGLITNLDPSSPRGLKVTGNLRLYYGPFDSAEYVELPFESLQFDPFRRTVAGKTDGSLRLTVSGTLSNDNQITGTLSDDSLGQVGEFEVEKYEP